MDIALVAESYAGLEHFERVALAKGDVRVSQEKRLDVAGGLVHGMR